MNSHQLEDNLLVIRTLMERSAIYRRALRPIMWWAGGLAVVSAAAGWWWPPPNIRTRFFIIHWVITGLLVLTGAFLLARRQAIKDGEPFWSLPARRVAQAILPCLFVGLILTIVFFNNDSGREALVGFWALLYGCALHAAGFFAPRGLRTLGWLFIVCGSGWWFVLATTTWAPGVWLYVVMGLIFGGLHLGYAIYLMVTAHER